LVTGHDGYIGAVLVPHLLERGYEVVGLDTFYYGDCWLTQRRLPIRAFRKDVRDVEQGELRGFDAIIHLAALSNDPVGALAPDLTLDINYRASVRLAELAKQAGVRRFVYASSCSLYGKTPEEWVDETCPMAPLTAYAQSKVLTEEGLHKLADSHFSPIILRFATVYGISPKLRIDLVANNLAGWGVITGEIRILSDGTPWRPLIHVEDVAAAYEFSLRVPLEKVHNQTFNVGFNSHNYQVRDIAEQVAEVLPEAEVSFASEPDRDSRSYRVRFDRFQTLSGLKPQWDLKSGVQQIVEAYQQVGLTQEALTGRKYVRLNQIKHLIEVGRLDAHLRWSGIHD
jgi:nucleoside-diphosphate-sugar epimerase